MFKWNNRIWEALGFPHLATSRRFLQKHLCWISVSFQIQRDFAYFYFVLWEVKPAFLSRAMQFQVWYQQGETEVEPLANNILCFSHVQYWAEIYLLPWPSLPHSRRRWESFCPSLPVAVADHGKVLSSAHSLFTCPYLTLALPVTSLA